MCCAWRDYQIKTTCALWKTCRFWGYLFVQTLFRFLWCFVLFFKCYQAFWKAIVLHLNARTEECSGQSFAASIYATQNVKKKTVQTKQWKKLSVDHNAYVFYRQSRHAQRISVTSRKAKLKVLWHTSIIRCETGADDELKILYAYDAKNENAKSGRVIFRQIPEEALQCERDIMGRKKQLTLERWWGAGVTPSKRPVSRKTKNLAYIF